MSKLLDGLVKAVAKDGSVWWVKPDAVASVSKRDSAFAPASDSLKAFYSDPAYDKFVSLK